MSEGLVKIYFGEGKGKSTATLGQAVVNASKGKEVFMIQFLKGSLNSDLDYLKRLEPEVKVFRFEKTDKYYLDLSEEEKADEKINILNGVNFAKKVLKIGECDILILDEILGLVDLGILTEADVIHLIDMKNDEMELILTGRTLSGALAEKVDIISEIRVAKRPSACEASAE